MDKLKELLDGLVAEKSLSFEVLEQLRKVKTESEELVKVNLSLDETLKIKEEDIKSLNLKLLASNGKLTEWENREVSLVVREKAVLDIEHKNEIEKLKATHSEFTLVQVKEIVGMVFKNTVIRESVNKTVGHMVSVNGQYPSTHSTCDNENKEIKEE